MFRLGQKRLRLLAWAGVFAAVCSLSAAGTAVSASGSTATGSRTAAGPLKAFQRPTRPSDALPHAILPFFSSRYGGIVASRRIATATVPHGSAALYLVQFKRNYTCMIQVFADGGAGAGCDPSGEFFPLGQALNAGTGNGVLDGVVANKIARVAFVDAGGHLHPLNLTRDGGFLYACRHRNGCTDLVTAIKGYNRRGQLVSHESLP
jgi:hypothetical protein